MLKISDAVQREVRMSESIFESLRLGVLNLSSYADLIQKRVAEACMKPVRRGSIVVALSRLQKQIEREASIRPTVYIDDISVKSPLCDLSFVRQEATLLAAKNLQTALIGGVNDFLTITQGMHEITVICPEREQKKVLELMGDKPKIILENLSSISLRFDPRYTDVPNAIYTIIGVLAIEAINILEIVSTYTELTILIREADASLCIEKLRSLQKAR